MATQVRKSYGTLIAAGILIFIALKAYTVLSHILISFLLIMLFSLAVNPIVVRLRTMIGGRTVATIAVALLFLMIMGLASYAFYRPVKRTFSTFAERLPQYWERVQRPLVKLEQKAVIREEKVKKEVKEEIAEDEKANPTGPPDRMPATEPPPQQSGNVFKNSFSQWAGGITNGFLRIASNAASIALIAITVFVGVIFTLLNPKPIIGAIFGFIPQQHHPKAFVIIRRIVEFVPQWAKATFLGMTVIGLLVFFAMWPIFGFQDAIVLGIIAMVFEAVPYLGPILSTVPALLLGVTEGGWTPLWVLISYAVVQLLENNVIYPMIVGQRLSLHPLAVIFSILLCVAAFGVLGVILAIPLAAVARILLEEIYRARFLPDVSPDDLDDLARRALIPPAHHKSTAK